MQVFHTQVVAQAEAEVHLRPKLSGLAAVLAGLWDFARRKPVGAAGGVGLLAMMMIGVLTRYA